MFNKDNNKLPFLLEDFINHHSVKNKKFHKIGYFGTFLFFGTLFVLKNKK